MAKALGIQEAKERAGRFCSFRERSPNEVLEKLRSWGLKEQDCTMIVTQLLDLNFINEQRFANAYCHDKFEFNSWGKIKIRTGIYTHQLPSDIVQNALDRINQEKYQMRLMELAQNKWDKLAKEEELKRKKKTVNYLAGKGFELDLIWGAIEAIQKP